MMINGSKFTVELFDSIRSGKKKVCRNGTILIETKTAKGQFYYQFAIGKVDCTISQLGEMYELKVNKQSFTQMLNAERTRREFKSGSSFPEESVGSLDRPSAPHGEECLRTKLEKP